MHKSFGFVQYDNPVSAQDAIRGANHMMLAGLTIGEKMKKNCGKTFIKERKKNKIKKRGEGEEGLENEMHSCLLGTSSLQDLYTNRLFFPQRSLSRRTR